MPHQVEGRFVVVGCRGSSFFLFRYSAVWAWFAADAFACALFVARDTNFSLARGWAGDWPFFAACRFARAAAAAAARARPPPAALHLAEPHHGAAQRRIRADFLCLSHAGLCLRLHHSTFAVPRIRRGGHYGRAASNMPGTSTMPPLPPDSLTFLFLRGVPLPLRCRGDMRVGGTFCRFILLLPSFGTGFTVRVPFFTCSFPMLYADVLVCHCALVAVW